MIQTRLFRTLAATALIAFAAAPALAADGARVDRYIELSRMEAMTAQMVALMHQGAEQGLQQAAQQSGVSAEKLKQAREMLMTQMAGMAEALSWEAMKPELAALIAETFTDAELDAANAFFASEEGQSILAKQPALMQQAGQIGQRRMMEVMPVVQAEIKRIVDEMQAGNAD